MTMDVLRSRVSALSNNLGIVLKSLDDQRWRPQSESNARAELLETLLWDGMRGIKNWIEKSKEDLEEQKVSLQGAAMSEDQAAKAWTAYNNILSDSRTVLHECLEIIGTLAIRNKDLDEKILHVADELIRDCVVSSTGNTFYYLTVHGLSGLNPAKWSRIIRLGFPEWTIWELPLAAHELGLLLIELFKDDETLHRDRGASLVPFAKKQQALLMNNGRLDTTHPDAEQWAAGQVREFMADAFATYTMGPAYACASINLRFNPFVAADRDAPSDAQRAHIVISMLEWMSAKAKSDPYRDVIGKLRNAWSGAMAQCAANSLAQADEDYLGGFSKEFAESVCRQKVYTPGMFSSKSWLEVQKWVQQWGEEMPKARFQVPDAPTAKLRDVLNATWSFRLAHEKLDDAMLTNLEESGKQFCARIMDAARPRGTGLQGPPAAGR